MEPTVIVALIGAVPASLAAWAGVVAARRANGGRRDIRKLWALMEAHVKDGSIHHQDPKVRPITRRENRL